MADESPLNELRWQRATFPTPRHERVHDLLRRLISEGAAHFFADACDIIQREPPFRSTTHLVGHLSREVESALCQVLITLPDAAASLEATDQAKRKKDGHLSKIDAILDALSLSKHPEAGQWRAFAGRTPHAWHGAAHRDDLRRPRRPDQAFRTRFQQFVDVLHAVLSAAEGSYAKVLAKLDVVVEKVTPTEDDVGTLAVHLAPGVTALSHVFDKLSASWIKPLRDLRVFADPPDVEVLADGSFLFPSWPQTEYLRRVAADAPGAVTDTIEALPATRNESVHLAVLETAIALPPALAARVARHELPWIGDSHWLRTLLPKAIGQLVMHLWSGGERECALEVLRAALALGPPDDDESWSGPEARTSAWSYGELAKATLPPIGADDSPAAIALLFGLVTQAKGEGHLLLRRRLDAPGHPGLDEPLEILYAHLRDLLLAEAARSPEELQSAVRKLEAKGSATFDRLALHLLRVHGALATNLVVERASDPSRLSAGDLDDEMTLMVRDRFPDLEATDRERVFGAIRETTSPEWLRDEFDGRLDDSAYVPVGEHRLLKWLHLLRDHLTTDQQREYERLLATHGPPATGGSRLQFGPNPPRRAAELADLQDDELLTYLREWEPESEDPFEPSRRGLGQELRAVVELDAARFGRLAREFRGHRPEYVANVVWGLHDAIKRLNEWNAKPEDSRGECPEDVPAEATIDWSSILDLVKWTATQKTTSETEGADGNWTWGRRMAVDLAEEVFVATTGDPSLPWRAWDVIQSLLSDPDPTSQREATTGYDNDTFALNTVRGQALHAAIRISTTWKRRKGKQDLLDSVCPVLKERAQPDVEPALAIRSVLAMRFTDVCWIDEGLAADVAVALFGVGAPDDTARITAWGSFLKWNEPWPATYRILESTYEAALQRLGGDEVQDRELGKHLAWLAARGGLDFRVADSQLLRFVVGASAAARHRALDDVGRAIHRTKEALANDVQDRLCELWDWWAALSLASGDASDLVAFGWWFSRDHFDASWSLRRLNEVLEATGGAIDWDHAVVEKLVEVVEEHPTETATALARFVDSADEWQARRNRPRIRAILTTLRDTAMADASREMASRLVARGWLDFRDLTNAG